MEGLGEIYAEGPGCVIAVVFQVQSWQQLRFRSLGYDCIGLCHLSHLEYTATRLFHFFQFLERSAYLACL